MLLSAPLLTIKPLAVTRDVASKTKPLGLTNRTTPLEVTVPLMVLAALPVMRLRVALVLVGTINSAVSLAARLKLLHSITARSLVWLMVVVVGLLTVMVAAPPTRVPPAGRALALFAATIIIAADTVARSTPLIRVGVR
ncbi:MAG: hypothetical protein QM523_04200 [Candidatus Pacebacteria bacterium]|nr:hypothetical protein [Candidatus Paceibacterota bacterium]